ncbi:MAG TPA: VWA domain-containing protein [Fimbriiglobus sp.]|nr:VWA domain-containing protein [Fimbriiglobus sp.]
MYRLTDFLEVHWLTVALLVASAAAIVRVFLRRSAGRGIPPVSLAVAYTCGLLGLGALLVPSWAFTLSEWRLTVAQAIVLASAFGFVVAGLVLAFLRAWSFWVGVALGGIAQLGLGGWAVPALAAGITQAVRSLRGLEFVRPEWLFLLVFVPVIVLMSRRSLSGLGPTRKWTAITLRALGVACLAMALAEPRIRRSSEHVTVLFVVDRSFSVPQDLEPDKPATEAVDRRWEHARRFIEETVRRHGQKSRHDQAGLVLFGKRPRLALPPSAAGKLPVDERMAGPIDGNYTDIAAAIKLALASFPEGTGKRIVLVSDGNENIGSAEEQANLAKQNGVEIDAIALAPGFRNESEVLVQAVEAPPVTAQGQRLPIRVLVRNATPDRVVDGRLEVLKSSLGQNQDVEIEDSPQVLEEGRPPKVRLLPGLNVFRFRDRVDPRGDTAFAYRATFTPTESRPLSGGTLVGGLPGDRAANNRAAAAVVSRGQRRVLFLDENDPKTGQSQHEHLLTTLRRARIRVDRLPAERLPVDKGELGVFLGNYDLVILANVPAERLTQDQMEMLRSTVYDQGCGLVMIGGPDAFGPGGYQGTPVEAALPVDCEIKALKAAGRGGLVLVMHASEMADGNRWQKEIAKLAIQRLGPADMVGVSQYGFGGGSGVSWVIPFQEVGEDRNRLLAKVDGMMPGDMPDFDPFLTAAADTLTDQKHNLSVKHCIVISDGDPQYNAPGRAAVRKMADNGATCTTVGVATHGVNEDAKMKSIAEGTRDADGKPGNFYKVGNPNQLPAIYIKESRRVSQSFIYKEPFVPGVVGGSGSSDVLAPGLPNPLPRLHGFVRTTLKSNVLVGMALEGPTPYPDQRFPLLASWRYGLGKAVAFTSDARTQPGAAEQWWDKDWVGSEMYQKFWEQVVNWSMREAERGRLTLVSEYRDGRVRVTADVRDEKDRPVGGLDLRGAVTPPGALAPGDKPPQVEFRAKGGGIYEAEFPADEAGSYFVNVQALEPERGPDGNVILEKDGTARMKTFDAARAGVTVPYSPEFADLESNTPLLRRLTEVTGGRFHTEADEDLQKLLASGELFREAPATVRALLPFWYWLVFAAGLLLLLDVATRRIAIEWAEVRSASRKVWANLRHQEVAAEESAGLGRLLRRKAEVGEVIDRGRATRRFEPSGTPSDPAPAGADEYVSAVPGSQSPPPAARRADEPAAEEEEDTFSKLRKAKERARRQQQQRGEGETPDDSR